MLECRRRAATGGDRRRQAATTRTVTFNPPRPLVPSVAIERVDGGDGNPASPPQEKQSSKGSTPEPSETVIPDVEAPSAEEAEELAKGAPESGKAKRMFAKGAELAKDPLKAKMILEDAMRKAKRHEGALGKAWGDLQTLFAFVKDSVTGRYKPELTSLGLAIGALLYFLSPIDVIPDFITALGYLDDVAILGFAVHKLRDELVKYRTWKDTLDITPDGDADAVAA